MQFECDFSPFRIQTLTCSHPCLNVKYHLCAWKWPRENFEHPAPLLGVTWIFCYFGSLVGWSFQSRVMAWHDDSNECHLIFSDGFLPDTDQACCSSRFSVWILIWIWILETVCFGVKTATNCRRLGISLRTPHQITFFFVFCTSIPVWH